MNLIKIKVKEIHVRSNGNRAESDVQQVTNGARCWRKSGVIHKHVHLGAARRRQQLCISG
jgi:hypothetical protein